MGRLSGFLKRKFFEFRSDRKGNIAIIVAAGMSTIVGSAAIGVDMNYLFTTRAKLSFTADSAALAAAAQLPDEAAAVAAAIDFASQNMDPSQHGNVVTANDVLIGYWDTNSRTFAAGASPTNAVQVVARRSEVNNNPAELLFGKAMGFDDVNISASATATGGGGGGGTSCIIALHPTDDHAVEVNSNGLLDAINCEIRVNSNSTTALYVDSNAQVAVTAGGIYIVGDYSVQSNSEIDPSPTTGSEPIADPMAGLPAPSFGSCEHNSYVVDNDTVTLDPGVYCSGLIIKNNSNVTLNPGTYVIRHSQFLVDSNSTLSGSGVLVYVADGAKFSFHSNTTIDLTAPASGTYEGVLFFAEPGNNKTHVMDSNNHSNFGGLIYFPDDRFVANSNTLVTNGQKFTYLIAETFYIDSNAQLSVDPVGSSAPAPPALASGSGNRLVN